MKSYAVQITEEALSDMEALYLYSGSIESSGECDEAV